MYKDVKKKLIALVLSICMVATVIEVVPIVRAAVSSEQTIEGTKNNVSSTYKVVLQSQPLVYNGKSQMPSFIVKDNSGAQISGDNGEPFYLELQDKSGSGAGTNAGEHQCWLKDSNNKYSFTGTITYEIQKATIQTISVPQVTDIPVVKWKEQGAAPDIDSLTVTLSSSDTITLNKSQFKIIPKTETGTVTSKIQITDTKNFNSVGEKDIIFNLAYDLAGSTSDNTSKYDVELRSDTASYRTDGSSQTPVVIIKQQDGTEYIDTSQYPNNFTVRYYDKDQKSITEIKNAGTYYVQLAPKNGSMTSIDKGGSKVAFTGASKMLMFTVTPKTSASSIKVKAYDEAGNDVTLYDQGSYGTTLSLTYVGNNKEVRPNNIRVIDTDLESAGKSSNINALCDFTWENDTGIGNAYMIITPKAESNIANIPIRIPYFIKSAITIDSVEIGGTTYTKTNNQMNYNGSRQYPTSVRVNKSNGEPLDIDEYICKYDYQIGGQWQGEVENPNTDYFKSTGLKKVIVYGQGGFNGQNDEFVYEILPVDMSKEEANGKLKLEFTGSPCVYNGKPQEPAFSLKYNGVEVSSDDYDVEWSNNIDAGTDTAILTVKASDSAIFTGSISKKFSILRLDIKNAVIDSSISDGGVPAFIYNRQPVDPKFKIGSYSMNESVDYLIEGYYNNATGEKLTGVPTSVGTYKVKIVNNNTTNFLTDSKTLVFRIIAADIDTEGFTLQGVNNGEIEWNGNTMEPAVTGTNLEKDVDYTYIYKDNSDVTTVGSGASIIISGNGNYTGTKTMYFKITPRGFSSVSGSGFTFDTTVSGTVSPGYKVELDVKDNARVSGQKNLSLNTDYTISRLRYFDDKNNEWVEVSSGSGFSTGTNAITGLTRAGKYELTIKGINKYTDELKTEFTCGTDISKYYAHIDGSTNNRHIYTGSPITPGAVISLCNASERPTGIASDRFTLDYERNDSYSEQLVDVGKIYVIAVGVPEKGYYGRTSQLERTWNYYTITSPSWEPSTLTVFVDTHGGITYLPNGLTRVPTITVTFNDKLLYEGQDYELSSDMDLTTAGQKVIKVIGINNYASNQAVAMYEVFKVDIEKAVMTSSDEAEYSGGRPNFTLNYNGYDLVEGTDYAKAVSYGALGEEFVWNTDHYEITYKVTGKGNFEGERPITLRVNISDLSEGQASFAESAESAKVGQYYVVWKEDELLLSSEQASKPVSERTPVSPSAFDVVYKKTATTSVTLKKGTDYQIIGGGTNVTPGNSDSNFVTIQGIGGYSGTRQLKFTLYTSITGAKTTSTSLIKQNGSPIAKTDWMRTYTTSGGGVKALVELKNLSFDEKTGVINKDEYDLSWTSGFDPSDPAVGTYVLRITGAQKPTHYYGGTLEIEFTVVNSIETAEITVNGALNAIRYDGTPAVVTGAGTVFKVVVDGVELKRGIDYEIVGYENNDAIGMARVKLEGTGNYAGNAYHDFKVTYPLKDLVVCIEASDGELINSAEETVHYAYNSQEITPSIRIFCPLDMPADTPYERITALSPGYYTVAYENNKNAGTATVIIKDCPYFAGDTQRSVAFMIDRNSICPPTAGAITYTTTKFANINNISVGYTGKIFTAEDLGIELRDRGTVLTSGNSGDYVLYYSGDRLNVSDPAHKPEITFVGVNNYEGSYTISYTITKKSLADSEITADPITITYSGSPIGDEVVSKLNVVQTDVGSTLVIDKDYQIEGYYTDALCLNRVIGNDGVPNGQGTYYVKLVGIGNYDHSRNVEITVNKKDMSEGITINFKYSDGCPISSTGEPLCTYNGKEHKPAVEVVFGRNMILTEGTDYTVSYNNNIVAGVRTAEVIVTGSGNYDGTFTRNFTIEPKDIADDTIHFSPINENYPFTGASVEPGTTMTITDLDLDQTLTQSTAAAGNDYSIAYEGEYDNEALDANAPLHSYAGEVTMKVTGNGNYTGEKEFTFYIGEDISQAYALYNRSTSESIVYNGLIQSPDINKISVEKNGLSIPAGSYDIGFYKDNVNKESKVTVDQFIDAGTYYITVVGVPSKGTYAKTPSQNCTYNITPKTIAGCTVSGYAGMYYYTGLPIQPVGITVTDTDLPQGNQASDGKRSVELVQNRDFTISYQNNNSAGKATIVATGIGNYTGTVYAYFTIENSTINNSGEGDSTSQGSISKDGMTTLTPDNIILTYDDSSNNFMRYTGAEVLPTVSFVGGYNRSDFEITGVNNVNPGKATLVIRGKGGNYSGAIYMYFNIKANLSTHGQMSAVPDQAYTGAILTPHVTVGVGNNVLTLNQDYQLTYSNNQNVGKATITAQGVGDYYYGSISTTFNISNGAGGMSVSGYASSYIYSGNAIEPDVTVTMNGVTLTKNRDYTVTYANNVNVGTATMTVRGIGSYSGTQTINYTIEAKNIENCVSNAIANVKYTGNTYTPVVALTDATTGKVLVQGSDYMITYSNNTNPGTASITITALSKNYVGTKVIPFKITSAAVTGLRTGTIKNNSIKLAWTSQSYADGYQICNAQNKVIATTANTSYTVKNLKSCTTYKYKVRSYVNNADGSMAYGDFSTAVSAKTLLNTPKLKAKSTKKGVVTLTWSKVSKATGYEIYYSTKRNGIYTKLKTVSSSSKRVYYDRGLATGEKYYYTIRAYRKVNGVKTYSNYNTIKAVTVK